MLKNFLVTILRNDTIQQYKPQNCIHQDKKTPSFTKLNKQKLPELRTSILVSTKIAKRSMIISVLNPKPILKHLAIKMHHRIESNPLHANLHQNIRYRIHILAVESDRAEQAGDSDLLSLVPPPQEQVLGPRAVPLHPESSDLADPNPKLGG